MFARKNRQLSFIAAVTCYCDKHWKAKERDLPTSARGPASTTSFLRFHEGSPTKGTDSRTTYIGDMVPTSCSRCWCFGGVQSCSYLKEQTRFYRYETRWRAKHIFAVPCVRACAAMHDTTNSGHNTPQPLLLLQQFQTRMEEVQGSANPTRPIVCPPLSLLLVQPTNPPGEKALPLVSPPILLKEPTQVTNLGGS